MAVKRERRQSPICFPHVPNRIRFPSFRLAVQRRRLLHDLTFPSAYFIILCYTLKGLLMSGVHCSPPIYFRRRGFVSCICIVLAICIISCRISVSSFCSFRFILWAPVFCTLSPIAFAFLRLSSDFVPERVRPDGIGHPSCTEDAVRVPCPNPCFP